MKNRYGIPGGERNRLHQQILHVGAGAGGTDLAVIEEDCGTGTCRHVRIAIVENDDRALAAKFQGDAFHLTAHCLPIQMPTSVEPVKLTLLTSGCWISLTPAVLPPPTDALDDTVELLPGTKYQAVVKRQPVGVNPPPISPADYSPLTTGRWFLCDLAENLASRTLSAATVTLICLGLASAFLARLIFSTPSS